MLIEEKRETEQNQRPFFVTCGQQELKNASTTVNQTLALELNSTWTLFA